MVWAIFLDPSLLSPKHLTSIVRKNNFFCSSTFAGWKCLLNRDQLWCSGDWESLWSGETQARATKAQLDLHAEHSHWQSAQVSVVWNSGGCRKEHGNAEVRRETCAKTNFQRTNFLVHWHFIQNKNFLKMFSWSCCGSPLAKWKPRKLSLHCCLLHCF